MDAFGDDEYNNLLKEPEDILKPETGFSRLDDGTYSRVDNDGRVDTAAFDSNGTLVVQLHRERVLRRAILLATDLKADELDRIIAIGDLVVSRSLLQFHREWQALKTSNPNLFGALRDYGSLIFDINTLQRIASPWRFRSPSRPSPASPADRLRRKNDLH